MRRRREAGQAILIVILALGLVLIAGVGLAIDVSNMFAHRQMAQSAADAAAQAGIMSVFDHTNTGPSVPYPFGSAGFTCATGTDANAETPCVYARKNGFGTSDSDTVYVDFPTSMPGVQLSTVDPVNLIRVTVTRTLQTGLIRFVGPSTSTVKAIGVAAIVDVVSPVPILVLHPTLDDAYQAKGNFTIKICGGPQKSIQVNSSSSSSISVSGVAGSVDLSNAGPDSTVTGGTTNCDGSGADFGDTGGPATYPGSISLGAGEYVQPASPIADPLLGVPNPPMPAAHPATVSVTAPTAGCPSGKCTLYSPGLYTSGITVKNEEALFSPGIYYITGGGFHQEANGNMGMATGLTDTVTGTGWTNNMLVFNTGTGSNDVFDFGANSDASLVGSPLDSTYKGILFFEDHAVKANLVHNLGGGGALSLKGTIYLTHTAAGIAADGHYQELELGGNSGTSTEIDGMIIVDTLYLHGNPNITMKINPAYRLNIRQVALVK